MIKYLWEKTIFFVTIILFMFVSTSYAGQETCERGESGCICSYTRDGSYVCYKTKIGDSCNPRGTFGSDGQDGEIGIGADTGNIGSSEGCYCDDGPTGKQNCRTYGTETSGFLLAQEAGQGKVPALRINLTYTSDTEPNRGELECWDITNENREEYFIPTASQEEWNTFKAKVLENTVSGVTMTKCPSCGDRICSNPATYWGYIEGCGSDDSMNPSVETGDPMCNTDCHACPIVCGDGVCAAGAEDCTGGIGDNPCADCGACTCGDADFDCTGQCGKCADCSPCCEDGVCDATEDNTTCAADCPATGVCTGAVPINSILCPGDDTGLTADAPNSSVTACTPGTKCEYLCNANTQFVADECRYCAVATGKGCDTGGGDDCSLLADCSLSDGCPVLGYCRVDYTGDCSVSPCGDLYECQICL
ncbi:MAG: hypothetical protein KBD53_00700 [Candidatus Omnitrophica bacterium]|nr:hypothetical protein [Candidatus Omnitrophota bacterium]